MFFRKHYSPKILLLFPTYHLPGGASGKKKNPPASAGDIRDPGSIPGLGRSPGGGHGNPLQRACLESPVDRGQSTASQRAGHGWSDLARTHARAHRLPEETCLHLLLFRFSASPLTRFRRHGVCLWASAAVLFCSFTQMTLTQKSESEVTQSCLALCDPTAGSLQGFSTHGTVQARALERVATSFSRGSSGPRDRTRVSHNVGRHFIIWATREVLLHRGPPNSWWKRVKFSQLLVPLMPWIFSTFPAGSVKGRSFQGVSSMLKSFPWLPRCHQGRI